MERSSLPQAARWLAVVVATLLLFQSNKAVAQAEVREFSILVDGSSAGHYNMTIQPQSDGAVVMTAQAECKVKVLLVTAYSYTFHGVEVWKDGRLRRYESSGAENNKKFEIKAAVEGDRFQVTTNGQKASVRPDVWVNTYWRLPEGAQNKEVALLGCDTGKEETRLLQHVGTERLTIAGQSQECSRYRIHTAPPHDLWFDGQGRLVRQEWVSPDRHRSVLELKQIRR